MARLTGLLYSRENQIIQKYHRNEDSFRNHQHNLIYNHCISNCLHIYKHDERQDLHSVLEQRGSSYRGVLLRKLPIVSYNLFIIARINGRERHVDSYRRPCPSSFIPPKFVKTGDIIEARGAVRKIWPAKIDKTQRSM